MHYLGDGPLSAIEDFLDEDELGLAQEGEVVKFGKLGFGDLGTGAELASHQVTQKRDLEPSGLAVCADAQFAIYSDNKARFFFDLAGESLAWMLLAFAIPPGQTPVGVAVTVGVVDHEDFVLII